MNTNSSIFRENAAELTGKTSAAAPSYSAAFGVACDVDAYEEKRELVRAETDKHKAETNADLEIVRQVRAGQSNLTTSAAFCAVAKNNQKVAMENGQKASADATFLALLEQIRDLEERLSSMYGENFAEDMVEGMHQNGKISGEERDRVMAIKDADERRQAIAELIQDKMRGGEITKDDLSDYEWSDQWLRLYEEKMEQTHNIAAQLADGTIDRSDPDVTNEALELALEIRANRNQGASSLGSTVSETTSDKDADNNIIGALGGLSSPN